MRPSAADRRRPVWGDGLVALLVAAVAVVLLFLFRPEGGNFLTATVVLEGETIARYDLSALAGPEEPEVEGAAYPITIQAEPGRNCQ